MLKSIIFELARLALSERSIMSAKVVVSRIELVASITSDITRRIPQLEESLHSSHLG